MKKRISLSVLPSLYDDIQKIAYVQRRGVGELMSSMMEDYRGSHAAELARLCSVVFFKKLAVGNHRLPKCKPLAVYIYQVLTYFGGTEDEIG